MSVILHSILYRRNMLLCVWNHWCSHVLWSHFIEITKIVWLVLLNFFSFFLGMLFIWWSLLNDFCTFMFFLWWKMLWSVWYHRCTHILWSHFVKITKIILLILILLSLNIVRMLWLMLSFTSLNLADFFWFIFYWRKLLWSIG